MTIYYQDEHVTLHHGDCLDVLATLPDESVHAVVTDPPYALEFMGRKWDGWASPAAFQQWCEVWARECLRALKPGGHMLAFGGSRTWHRLAVAVEDAGFEIRDSIAWLYGSGFPKGHNLSGDWQGWGTSLKPSFEPIVMGRKSFTGTIAATVAKHGTGALHVDACRIEMTAQDEAQRAAGRRNWSRGLASGRIGQAGQGRALNAGIAGDSRVGREQPPLPPGRWPSNVAIDESAAIEMDRQTRVTSSPDPTPVMRNRTTASGNLYGNGKGIPNADIPVFGYGDTGGASRFFPVFRYESKARAGERPEVDGITHPTVKPLALMRWLIRLVTPPGGVVLEPFAGSGTTIEACLLEGFRCIGVEREADYLPLIMSRINKPIQTAIDFETP